MARVPCSCSCMNILAWSVTLSDRIRALMEIWDEGRGLLFMDVDDVQTALAHLAGIWIALDKLANGYPSMWGAWGNFMTRINESVSHLAEGIRGGKMSAGEVTNALRAMHNRAEDVYTMLTTECENP